MGGLADRCAFELLGRWMDKDGWIVAQVEEQMQVDGWIDAWVGWWMVVGKMDRKWKVGRINAWVYG